MRVPEGVLPAVARQLLRGLRESLSIAGQVGSSVAVVNATLRHLQAACDHCLVLTQPYAGEPRLVVTIVEWEAFMRAARSLR